MSALQRVAATSPNDSLNKSVTVTCPAGKRVLGTGSELFGATGRVTVDETIPNVALTSVLATGFEDGAFAGNWTITAYAICGNVAP